MLKVTFPHLGKLYIALKSFLAELGVEPLVPPLTSQRTIARGTKIAPEFACLPFKINLGNFLEAIEAGAECIFMVGGSGPCRLGYYGETQREILRENGYGIDFIILEAPGDRFCKLWEDFKRYLPRHRPQDLLRAWQIFWQKAKALDHFERRVNQIRPLEARPGICNQLQERFDTQIDNACAIGEVKQIDQEFGAELAAISQKESARPLKIGLLGELFMVLEPRVNFQVEKALGALGVEVRRTIYLTDWIREHLFYKYFNPGYRRRLQLLAQPYLNNFIGGHGLESVAHTVESGINHSHGVVHLSPFTCMPEIMALQIIPKVAKDYALPVLTLILDEHSAEAGIKTRLEAFIDLLKHRRQKAAEPGERS
jgi:predicted nucleotide-binding protein (sugar kinase/HSP70/actin superfamily)